MLFPYNIKSFLVSVIIIKSNARILLLYRPNPRIACRFFRAQTIRKLIEIHDFRVIVICTATRLVRTTTTTYSMVVIIWYRHIFIFPGFEFIC